MKGEKLAKYLEIVRDIAQEFLNFQIEHIPREENTEADALENLASSLNIPEGTNIPILHICHPAIDTPDINQLSDHEDIELQVPPRMSYPG